MIETIRPRLEAAIAALKAYEQPLESDQYDAAISVVCDLQAILRQINAADDLRQINAADSPQHYTDCLLLMVSVGYARAQADEARLLLAAYRPHSRSVAARYLRERRACGWQLERLLEAAVEVAQHYSPTKRPHPDYLYVVSEVVPHDQQPRGGAMSTMPQPQKEGQS